MTNPDIAFKLRKMLAVNQLTAVCEDLLNLGLVHPNRLKIEATWDDEVIIKFNTPSMQLPHCNLIHLIEGPIFNILEIDILDYTINRKALQLEDTEMRDYYTITIIGD